MSKIFSVFIEIIILCYYVLILLMFYLILLTFSWSDWICLPEK